MATSIPRLTSVQVLFLEVPDMSEKQFLAIVPLIFPNVHRLKVKIDLDPNSDQVDRFRLRLMNAFPELTECKVMTFG